MQSNTYGNLKSHKIICMCGNTIYTNRKGTIDCLRCRRIIQIQDEEERYAITLTRKQAHDLLLSNKVSVMFPVIKYLRRKVLNTSREKTNALIEL